MRIAIYARKSTESEDRQVQSLQDQVSEMRKLADREGLTVSKVYRESASAKAPYIRPIFEELIREIEDGKLQGVLTWSVNRLSRNPVDGGRIAYLLQTEKLDLIRTIERAYRPEDNALLLSIETGMATAQLQELKRNVKRGLLGKALRGWHACKAPVGYLNNRETREIMPDPKRFQLVRKGWDLLLGGDTNLTTIHRELVAEGLTTSSRRSRRMPISRAKIHTLFRDPFYMGRFRFNGTLYEGKHEPMITLDEYERAQEILRCRSFVKKPQPARRGFEGLFRCAVCGCLIVREVRYKIYPRVGRKATYIYYHCSGSKGCPKKGVREEDLLALAKTHLLRLQITRPTAEWLKNAMATAVESGLVEKSRTLSKIEAEKSRHERRLRELSILRLDGEVSRSEFGQLRKDIEASIYELTTKIADLRDHGGKLMRLSYRKIDAAAKVGDLLTGSEDDVAIGKALQIAGGCTLNLSTFDFRLDAILEKITAFEPLRTSSEIDECSDLLPLNSVWWTLIEDLLKTTTDQIAAEDAADAQRTPMQRREERKRQAHIADINV